ncbi:protein kinase [Streptomyces sp. NPDC058622]|uniref:serine/threonine-protein kinase n=1 Tax=Streptomyces sp. NPDC058622 TaxID=3346562 RepID=UPI00364FE932
MLELTGSGAGPLEAGDPRRIGSIPLAGRLGAGGMGRVYLGVREGRYVAVKQLLASVVGEDEDFVRRFGHELDNLARLPEGATAPLLDSDRTARPPWFATAYVPGITLKEAVDLHRGPLPAHALWLLLREAASSLAAVHALDMVHRDLKPSNVMLTLDGLTLIDFGVARVAEQSQLTRTGMVVGTPAYMAPEQASGKRRLSGATDVFALGSVLAYAACGQPPFGDESGHGVLYRIVHEQPDLEPLRELEPELADLVATCLDKDPGNRPTAAGLLERASRLGPFATPLWPAAITERLSERAAFAADVREADVPTLPLAGGKPGTAPDADSAPGTAADPAAGARAQRPQRPGRSRRTRVFLAVVPVVVVAGGTTLALQLLPHTTELRSGPQGTPPASASAPADPAAATAAGSPSGAVPPGQSPAGALPGDPVPDGGQGGAGTNAGAGGAQPPAAGGAAAAGGAVGGTNTGAGNGGGNSGNPGTPGTPPGGGNPPPASAPAPKPTGGGTKPTTAPPPASGTHSYRNGNNGRCITQVFGASDHGSCSDSTARWTVRSASGGNFKLVNAQTGQCLYSNGLNQAVFVGDCAQDIGRLWRSGAGATLVSGLGGGCLDLGMSSGLVTASCGGQASQRWTSQG